MKREKNKIFLTEKYVLLCRLSLCLFFLSLMLFTHIAASAQEKQMVQIKTFNPQLQPYKNISISINGRDYISMGSNGITYVEFEEKELPVKSIEIKDDKLEAASWNHSKGTLEIIIRKKNYSLYKLSVKTAENLAIPNVEIIFKGKNNIKTKTNVEGQIEIALPLNEKVISVNQFSVEGFDVLRLQASEEENILIVEEIKNTPTAKFETPAIIQPTEDSEKFFKNFDLSMLDSIQSLTVFYAIFKNYNIEDMDSDLKEKVDAKFNELVGKLETSIGGRELTFLNNISDSTYVRDDINNLMAQARMESQMLVLQQTDFEEKTQLINDKLEVGFENLDEAARANLLEDLNRLEAVLTENESRFYRNQNSYRQVINTLKERFFNLEELENKLSASEAQRLEEQRVFRQRLLTILLIASVFAILIVLLIYFSNKLEKQKKKLVTANAEIRRINENLEEIVSERTKMLEETNKELDTVLYRASHDLRSPVCSIIGLCNIATTVSHEESGELLDKVVQTTVGMDKLLKKLSIISEINNPRDLAPVNLFNLVQTIQRDFNQIIDDHSINFVVKCPDDLVIESYPHLIEVILSNLIENALFFCMIKRSTDYKVMLEAAMKDGHLEISLFDNGVGVDSTMSDKLFDMFFRGNEYSKGNGLGLYIVKKSVHALNGNITVESEPGQFTKFIMQLPLKVVEPVKQQEEVVLNV